MRMVLSYTKYLFACHREFPIVTADLRARHVYFDGVKAIYSGF